MHFYTSAGYPILIKKLKNKLKTSQNECIQFFLYLDSGIRIAIKEFAINCNRRNNIMEECNILVYVWSAKSKTGVDF